MIFTLLFVFEANINLENDDFQFAFPRKEKMCDALNELVCIHLSFSLSLLKRQLFSVKTNIEFSRIRRNA